MRRGICEFRRNEGLVCDSRTNKKARVDEKGDKLSNQCELSAVRCTSLLEDGQGKKESREDGIEIQGLPKFPTLIFLFFFWRELFWGDFGRGEELRNGLLTASDYSGAWRVE